MLAVAGQGLCILGAEVLQRIGIGQWMAVAELGRHVGDSIHQSLSTCSCVGLSLLLSVAALHPIFGHCKPEARGDDGCCVEGLCGRQAGWGF